MTMRSSRAHLVHLLASLTYLQACSRTHKVFSAVEQRAPTSPTSARTRCRESRFGGCDGHADSPVRPTVRSDHKRAAWRCDRNCSPSISASRSRHTSIDRAINHRPRDGKVVSCLHCMNDPQPEGHMASYIRRRKFLATLGGAAVAWPLAARAQQAALPVIWYLNYGSPESDTPRLTGLRRGLNQSGYVEGRNLVIEYRWAGNQADRLPALAADLVQLRVAVIVAAGALPALAAKAADRKSTRLNSSHLGISYAVFC